MEIQSVSCQIQYILMETDSSRREEQKLEIAFRLLIDTEGWVWGSLEGSPGGNPSRGSPLIGSPRGRLVLNNLG